MGLLSEALRALGEHGDRTGTVLALETGLESGEVLRRFLDRFDTGGLGVNLDPANLLTNGFDPYTSARALHGKIVHTHARDARRAGPNRAAQEVLLGDGDIDWVQYLGSRRQPPRGHCGRRPVPAALRGVTESMQGIARFPAHATDGGRSDFPHW
jgi:sugar phosphate isomerase/epimerase